MPENNAPAKRGRAAESIAARIATDLLDSGLPTIGKDQETVQVLRAFIFHHDYSAGLRAKEAFDHIGQQLKSPHVFDLDLWRTALLEDFGLRRAAARLAARADIIFLALQGLGSLPPGLRAWLGQWMMQRELRPCVLVASFDERHRYSLSVLRILDDLLQVAAPQGLDVIPHFALTPPETAPSLTAPSETNPLRSIMPDPAGPPGLNPAAA